MFHWFNTPPAQPYLDRHRYNAPLAYVPHAQQAGGHTYTYVPSQGHQQAFFPANEGPVPVYYPRQANGCHTAPGQSRKQWSRLPQNQTRFSNAKSSAPNKFLKLCAMVVLCMLGLFIFL